MVIIVEILYTYIVELKILSKQIAFIQKFALCKPKLKIENCSKLMCFVKSKKFIYFVHALCDLELM